MKWMTTWQKHKMNINSLYPTWKGALSLKPQWNGSVHKSAFQWLAYFDKDLLLVNITTAVSPKKSRVLVGKPEIKRPLGRSRHRWEDNIMIDLQEVGCGSVDWIGLAQNRDRWQALVNVILKLWVPYNVKNFLTGWKSVSFSRRTLLHWVSEFLLNNLTLLKRHSLKIVVHWLCYCP